MENITLNSLACKDNSTLFETYKVDCINIIDKINEDNEDVTLKSKLVNMKESLLEKNYNEDNFTDDILMLGDLKETLKKTWQEK